MRLLPASLLALFALLTATACAANKPEARPPAPAPEPTRLHARGYSVPLLDGFYDARLGKAPPQAQGVIDAGGLVLIEKQRPMEGAFLASVVIAPIPTVDMDPTDAASCEATAKVMAQHLKVELLRAQVVELKVGKTCQWELLAHEEPPRGTRATIMPGKNAWMLTCNYDDRDAPAHQGCDQVIAGWTFDAEQP